MRNYAVTLRKPLGLVLEEKPSTREVYVAEVVHRPHRQSGPQRVVPGGNADKGGAIQPGDLLRRCSATTLKGDTSGSDVGHGEYLYNNWSRTMIDCKGLAFDTIMAAIASNNERWGIFDVELELERPLA